MNAYTNILSAPPDYTGCDRCIDLFEQLIVVVHARTTTRTTTRGPCEVHARTTTRRWPYLVIERAIRVVDTKQRRIGASRRVGRRCEVLAPISARLAPAGPGRRPVGGRHVVRPRPVARARRRLLDHRVEREVDTDALAAGAEEAEEAEHRQTEPTGEPEGDCNGEKAELGWRVRTGLQQRDGRTEMDG